MKNKLTSAFFLLGTVCLNFGHTSVFAATATCTQDYSNSSPPVFSWDNNQYTQEARSSSFNGASCNAPANSTIKSVSIAHHVTGNQSIFTNGLLSGDYTVSLHGNGIYKEFYNRISGTQPIHIGSTFTTTDYNGIDVNNLSLTITSQLKNSIQFRCANSTPSVCEDYMKAGYKLEVTYDTPSLKPETPAWIQANVTSGNGDIGINWEYRPKASYYEYEIQFNSNPWTGFNYRSNSNGDSWQGLNPGERKYRVRACNQHGCSEPSVISNSTYILEAPSTPTASANGKDISIDWNDVPHADSYVYAIKFNNNPWTTFRFSTTASQDFWPNINSGTRMYQVKACRNNVCFQPSGISNSVTN